MTDEEATRRMGRVVAQTTEEFGNIMRVAAVTALVLLRDRIQTRGEDADGEKYDPYSTKPMLVSRKGMNAAAYNKIAGSKEKRRDLKWVTIGGSSGYSAYLAVSAGTSSGGANAGKGARLFELAGGYKEFRDLHGRQTGFVDFAFSGRMWANITLVSSESEHRKGVARITAPNEDEYKKLEGNTARRGAILDLNEKEMQEVADIIGVELDKIWKRNGLT